MPKLYDYFEIVRKKAPITKESWEKFENKLDFHDFKKSDFMLRPGSMDRKFYIVMEGVVRNYCLDENGREYTKTFRGPSGLIGPYAEILQDVPSLYFIQAVTDVKVLSFNYAFYEQMMEEFPEWQILGRKMAEENFMEKEQREYMLLQLSAGERLEKFYERFGELVDQIPQYQVASYLGMTPESFNRLLKKMK
ncbi:MAG: Crp/Fnr family transcriptional regulator [Bacteriovoracaceae bacterium]|nr:Crp/Fnr family transcriptional regulator [Bacteriovoracaceae bacterium]